ncbi:MAG: hypothetical protein IJX64_01790 [Clostridia bacterium]|nr:hypothetical protein [Clostridia bacterium]
MKKSIVITALAILCVLLSACDEKTSRLTKLGEYKGYTYTYNDPVVDDEEIREVIAQAHRITTAVKHDITDRDVICKDDFVVVSYTTYVDGALYGTKANDSFKVGTGHYLPDLEEQMIGKKLNVEYSIDVTLPSDYPVTDIAGKSVRFDITAKKLYYYEIPEMTDEYIQKQGYSSYDEYFTAIKESKLYDLNYLERQSVCQGIITQIIDNSKFDLAEEEVETEYNDVLETYNQIARIYELSLEDYVFSVLNIGDMETFYQQCRDEAEYSIKDALVRAELMRIADIELTDEEVAELAVSRFHYSKGSLFDMKEQAREVVTTQLLYDFLLENSVRVQQ